MAAIETTLTLPDPTGPKFYRVELDGRRLTTAAWTSGRKPRNPFRVRPSWTTDRTRLLVFAEGNRVRVLDRTWTSRFETQIDDTMQCQAGALSPRGRRLALSLCGSGSTEERAWVEIWDVDQGTLLRRLPGTRLHRIGFDPTGTVLVANPEPTAGPCAVSAETGDLVWQFVNPFFPDRLSTCDAWDFSRDGKTLAIGRRKVVDVVDAATREADPAFAPRGPETGRTGRTSRVSISDDGTLLASGGDTGRIVVHKL